MVKKSLRITLNILWTGTVLIMLFIVLAGRAAPNTIARGGNRIIGRAAPTGQTNAFLSAADEGRE